MGKVIRDNSIGQALGGLAGAFVGDPQREWQAYALKQRTEAQALEMQNAVRQREAQDSLIQQFDSMLTPERFNVPSTLPGPMPREGEMGPMPPVPNPQAGQIGDQLSFARAAARNAVTRGASIEDVYKSLGLGTVFAGGVPQNEGRAAQIQTILTGKLPDRNTPLTESQRVLMTEEQQRNKLRDAVSVPKEGMVLLSPEQGRAMGLKPDANGQFIARGPGAQALESGVRPGFAGTSMDAQASSIILEYQRALESGPVPPELERQARLAWNHLYAPKKEIRTGPNGSMDEVTIQPNVPPGFQQPGVMPAPAPAPQQAVPQQPVQPQAAPSPVSAPPLQPQQAPSLPTFAQPGAPGQITPTGDVNVQSLRAGRPEAPPENVKRSMTFIQNMDASLQGMNKMLDNGFRPTYSGDLFGPQAESDERGILAQGQRMLVRGMRGAMAPQDAEFGTLAWNFLNSVLRDESGAAVPDSEYPKYMAVLIPQATDTPQQLQLKRQNMQLAVEARRQGLDIVNVTKIATGGNPALMAIAARAAQSATGSPAGTPVVGGGAGAPAPVAPGGPVSAPRRVRLMPDGSIQQVQ